MWHVPPNPCHHDTCLVTAFVASCQPVVVVVSSDTPVAQQRPRPGPPTCAARCGWETRRWSAGARGDGHTSTWWWWCHTLPPRSGGSGVPGTTGMRCLCALSLVASTEDLPNRTHPRRTAGCYQRLVLPAGFSCCSHRRPTGTDWRLRSSRVPPAVRGVGGWGRRPAADIEANIECTAATCCDIHDDTPG